MKWKLEPPFTWINLVLVLITGTFFSGLLWLPDYLINASKSTFWPSSTLPPAAIMGEIKELFVRDNHDMFRILGEFIVLWCVLLVTPRVKSVKRLSWIPALLYFLVWMYQAYYALSIKLYYEHPNLINDLSLLREVVPVFLGQVGLATYTNLLGLLIAMLIGLLLIHLGFTFWIRGMQRLRPTVRYLLAGMMLVQMMVLVAGIQHFDDSLLSKPEYRALQWVTPKVIRSLRPLDSLMLADSTMEKLKQYDQVRLKNPPNVYLLFVESYGAVAKCLWQEGPLYTQLMDQYAHIYQDSGYTVYSTFSEAPIMGGRSWLSFTSAMTGLTINNHLTFNHLLSADYNYPHLVRYFSGEGYNTYRIKTMADQTQSTTLSYALADRFYAFDHWIKYEDFPYQGYQYDYFGGMPDQYALNYFDAHLLDKSRQPYFIFSINMTTHGPWHHVPPVLNDWRDLDTIKTCPDGTNRSLDFADESMRYFEAIRYAMEVHMRFIFSTVPDHSLVILIGDHQPPGMNFTCIGKITEAAVPVHLISRDRELVEGFADYGFIPGMDVPLSHDVTMKHAGLYSMLVRELIRHYGPEGAKLPAYRPGGVL